MSHEIRADYEQSFLFPPCLEDWVGPDHPARFIREFVEALDLTELGFVEHVSAEGRPPYANDLMLKVWLYGYLGRIRATRQLEKACQEHVSLLWLTGLHAPDHNSLWRFWRDNRQALREVFRAGVKVAAAQGLIGMICHAVDGTKIPAVASRRTVEHEEDLKKVLARVEEELGKMEAEIEAAERAPGGDYRLPQGLRETEKLRAGILESLAHMRQAERAHLHPQEREARLMPCEGRQEPAYNAQAVADAQGGIIVAAEAVNEESDNAQLIPMLEETEANLGGVAQTTLADGGYVSGEQLQEAEERGQAVLVAAGGEKGGPQRGEYDATKFTYDEGRDEVLCPQGQRLRFEGMVNKGGQREVRRYRCEHYAECPARALCSRRKDGRRIEISPQYGALLRQRVKRQDPVQKALLRRRSVIIEPVFASVKQAMGFRRWTVRGLDNVRTQWALLCTAHNLKKLYQRWATDRRVGEEKKLSASGTTGQRAGKQNSPSQGATALLPRPAAARFLPRWANWGKLRHGLRSLRELLSPSLCTARTRACEG
jgi:transposase